MGLAWATKKGGRRKKGEGIYPKKGKDRIGKERKGKERKEAPLSLFLSLSPGRSGTVRYPLGTLFLLFKKCTGTCT